MNFTRRTFLYMATSAVALPGMSRFTWAQVYPSRPVRIVVGFPAGGAADIYARLVGQWLSERLGQPFIIENRPGASSNTATESVVKADPNGYTLLLVSASNAWNTALHKNPNVDFIRDIAPVASIYHSLGVLVVHPSFPAKSVPELITHAKANPGKINMASGGVGSPQHVYGELFKMMAGIDMLNVPYRGAVPAMPDLLAGQVQIMFDNLPTSIEHIRAGRLRALAVTTATRSAALPDIPTVAEFVSGYEASAWVGLGAPKNTPVEIIERLNREVNAALADANIKTQITDAGYAVFSSSPTEFGRFIVDYTEKWGKVIREAD